MKNKLQEIVFKYTNILIPPAEHIFDNSCDVIDNSLLIINPPRHTLLQQYQNNILTHLQNYKVLATIFLNNSEQHFEDTSLFGTIILTTAEIKDKIVEDFYNKTPAKILAVTGTCGKTSTSTFVYELLQAMNIKSVLIGTLGTRGIDTQYLRTTKNTTPSLVSIKRILHVSAEQGSEVAVLEVSSHGIGEDRIKGINFDGGIWTAFHTDHLEYHPTLEHYFETKHNFMAQLPITIINENILQDQFEMKFSPTYVYGKNNNHITDDGFEFQQIKYNQAFQVKFFQQDNLLAAMLLLYFIGYKEVLKYNNLSVQIPSRMEYFGTTMNGAPVYSDDAYRPANIDQVINYFYSMNLKRIILITGAGGNRDRGEHYRKNLGLLHKKVYKLIVTDDNPRNENPIDIRNEIIGENNNILNIGCRFDALMTAFCIAKFNHIVLIISHGSDETVLYKNHYVLMNDKEIFTHYKFSHCAPKTLNKLNTK